MRTVIYIVHIQTGRFRFREENRFVPEISWFWIFPEERCVDAVFHQICEVLDQGNVEYVKWDMNRSLIDLYSAENVQGRILYDYVLGVYEFAEKLVRRYPNMLLEGCTSGGGRFDAGCSITHLRFGAVIIRTR